MTLRFDHLGLISDSAEKNQDLAGLLLSRARPGEEVSGDAAEGYAEVKAGAITIALHRGAMIDDVAPLGGTLLQFSSDDVQADIEVSPRPRRQDRPGAHHHRLGNHLRLRRRAPQGVLVELFSENS